jgi:ribosomal protein S18 acetylase RimI-like enzyme
VSAEPQVRLRPGTPQDAERFALVGQATFLESYAGLLPAEDILAHGQRQHAPQVYAAWLADPAWRCWLAEATTGGAPVGYLVMGRADLPLPDLGPRDLEIKRIYLLYRFQNLGLGRAMMEQALAWAREAGCPRLLLGVYSRNEAALAFYARMGFVQVGDRRFRVGANEYYDYVLGRAP